MNAAPVRDVAEAAAMFAVAIGTLVTAWLLVGAVRSACPPQRAALVETLPRGLSGDALSVDAVILSDSDARRDVRGRARLDVTASDVIDIRGHAGAGRAARDVYASIDDRTYRIASPVDALDANGTFEVAIPVADFPPGAHRTSLRVANSDLTSYTEAPYHVDFNVR